MLPGFGRGPWGPVRMGRVVRSPALTWRPERVNSQQSSPTSADLRRSFSPSEPTVRMVRSSRSVDAPGACSALTHPLLVSAYVVADLSPVEPKVRVVDLPHAC